MLLNAANLHMGGSVAVASSVLHELACSPEEAMRLVALASTEVHANLARFGTDTESFGAYHVVDTRGVGAAVTRLPIDPEGFDSVLTVFGPLYRRLRAPRNVMGFAQPWIAYPNNDACAHLSRTDRIRARAKYALVAQAFSAADVLVVEQEHVRQALLQRREFRSKAIEVVPNVVDSLHFDPTRWAPVQMPSRRSHLRLGVVSRGYPHKNLEVLPLVRDALRREHGIDAEFWVTLNAAEYRAATPAFRASVRTVGTLDSAQTPSFYRSLDGVLFTSLLECFSATPIEALAAEVPLFASDRPFVRETVGEHAVYVDPRDPSGIAGAVAGFFDLSDRDRQARTEAAFSHVAQRDYTSRDRAIALMRLADREL